MKIKRFNESEYLPNLDSPNEPIKNEIKTKYVFYITNKQAGRDYHKFLQDSNTLEGAISIYNSLINDNLPDTFYVEVEETKTKELTKEDFELLISQKKYNL